MERMHSEGIEPRFVSIDAGDYILAAFVKMGMYSNGAMGGQVPLSYTDILAFSQATNDITESWELQAVAEMSRAYLEGLAHGSKNVKNEPIDIG